MKELTLRPGTVAKEYIGGKRKKYFSPMQYLLIGIAVITFLSVNLHLGTNLLGNITVTGGDIAKINEQFIQFFYKFYNIFQLLTIPFTALYSWLFFRKAGYNYSENLVLNTFLIGQRHLFYLLFIPLIYFFPDISRSLMLVHFTIWTVYFIYAYIQFFRPKSKTWAAFKTIIIIWLFMTTLTGMMAFIFFFFFYHK